MAEFMNKLYLALIFLAILFFLMGYVTFRYPYEMARLTEQWDAFGMKAEGEPADWYVRMAKFSGGAIMVLIVFFSALYSYLFYTGYFRSAVKKREEEYTSGTERIQKYMDQNQKDKPQDEPTIRNQSPEYTLEAEQLLKAFQKQEKEANQKYRDALVQVTGTLSRVESGDGKTTLFLGNEAYRIFLRCTVSEEQRTSANQLRKGERITVKGESSGRTGMTVRLQPCFRVRDQDESQETTDKTQK